MTNINFPINKNMQNFVPSKLPIIHAYNINDEGHSLLRGWAIIIISGWLAWLHTLLLPLTGSLFNVSISS